MWVRIPLPHFMKITVTQRDINKGCRSDDSNCPIARAVRRAFHYKYRPSVFLDIFLDKPGIGNALGCRIFTMPKKARNFVSNFDFGLKVKPFSFEIKEIIQQ